MQSRIFCTRWNGLSKAPSSVDALDDKEFSGNILQLLTSSQDFIKIHNKKIWYKEPTTRIEKLSYPERAVFEVLVNALVHRDYGVIGSEIHIDMFDDRLTITNPGGMYDGIPVQDQNIENVISTRRNPIVADFMSRLDIMERRGSGFRKILNAIKNEPNYKEEDLPIITSTPHSFSFTLKNMNYGLESADDTSTENAPKSGLKTIKWPKKWPKKWPEKCQIIYDAIRENQNITIPELEPLCDTGHTTIKKMLAEMENEGFIKREGAPNGGYWTILIESADNTN